jgi:hypothetical protein
MSLVCYNRPRTNQGHSHVKGTAGTYGKSLKLLYMPITSKFRSPMLYPAELRGQANFSMTYTTFQIAAGHPVVKIDGTSLQTAPVSPQRYVCVRLRGGSIEASC